MQKRIVITSILTAAALFTVAGCSSNQSVKTTDGRTIVTDGKPQVMMTPGWSPMKMLKPAKLSRLTVTRLNP